MRDFDLKKLDLGLINSEIRHFDIKTVEVNSANTLFNVLSELALANLIDPQVIGKGTCLVEFTEKLIHLKRGIVENKLVPEGTFLDGAYFLVVTDDLLKIPGESEDISMFLLIECHVYTEFSVFLVEIYSSFLLFL